MSINLIEEEVMSARPTDEQNRESLLRYFEERRPYRKALGQTVFPDPFATYRDGVRTKAPTFTCGIPSGYDRHKRNGEKPCKACSEARKEYDRELRLKQAIKKRPCGTIGGYRRHRRNKEAPCDPCLQANAEHVTPKRPPRPRKIVECGTVAGYRRHLADKTPTCAPCRAANNTEAKASYRRRKARG